MNASADHLEFAPPQTGGITRALVLAVLAHLLLVAALTWGLRWKSSLDTPVAEAELWSSVPRQAAPKLVEAPVVAPPPPRPAPAPTPAPPAPQPDNADIVQQREKRQLEEKKREETRQQETREREQKQRADQKLAQEKKRAQEEKQEKEERAQKEKDKAEKLAQDKKREQDAKRQQELKTQQETRQLAEQRKANMERIAGLAGATGGPTATGTATQSSGPSASYGSKVAARVKPNIVFTEDPANNPMAVLEVRAAPDGTITSRKLLKSSGNKAWDDAVLRAIDKTETLPRDTDGRVPSPLEISFRPKD